MTRALKAARRIALPGLLAWLGGCSEHASGPSPAVADTTFVSNPVNAVPAAAASLGAAAARGPGALGVAGRRQTGAETDVVYAALPPRTVAGGVWAVLRTTRAEGVVTVRMRDGGFDPVAVAGRTGDVVAIEVFDADGVSVGRFERTVPDRRPPKIVRTVPPRDQTDVPVNGRMGIVFSEPVRVSSLSPTAVRLFSGSAPVAGTVRLLEGTGTMAAFVPSAPLAPDATYRLEVTQEVRDLAGDALAAPVVVTFTTGRRSTGPAAAIRVSPDTLRLVGTTYQMTAVVEDAAGSMLIDQPVLWFTSDPTALAVSATGKITALAEGDYDVCARVGDAIVHCAIVYVTLPGPAASIELASPASTVAAGDTLVLQAAVFDDAGRRLRRDVAWSSSDPAIAAIPTRNEPPPGWTQDSAAVLAMRAGSVSIRAASGAASRTFVLTVGPPRPVARLEVTPPSADLVPGGTARFGATLRDATGRVIGRPVVWASTDAAVATVDASGLARAAAMGTTEIVATSEGVSDTARVTVRALNGFASLVAGSSHVCALEQGGATYCWGSRVFLDSAVPVGLSDGPSFVALAAGADHSCGLTASGAAYCWGSNFIGQLGTGTTTSSAGPAAVVGGVSFASLTAGVRHSCGVSTAGAAYCWGANDEGQLGTGSTGSSPTPALVAGGHTFASLSAGFLHTCGVTTSGAAYCWGNNALGQLGAGTASGPSRVPVAVAGDQRFAAVAAAREHSCGLTTTAAAYCWGRGGSRLGNGSGPNDVVAAPAQVGGGHAFTSVTAGNDHGCGITAGGAAYCWGLNNIGQLGDGAGGPGAASAVPLAVAGGLTFSSLSAGAGFTCGRTTAGAAYCWGAGGSGQLGHGFTLNSYAPVKVAGQR